VIVRFEKARSRVYGSWAGRVAPQTSVAASVPNRQAEGDTRSAAPGTLLMPTLSLQKCAICGVAGPTGSGKRTFVRSVAYDLGRPIKFVHMSNLLTVPGMYFCL
jgi:hypothetical protein